MDLFFARQPIVDRHGNLTSYELLYRANSHANRAGVVDAEWATEIVLEAAFAGLGTEDRLGGHQGFVNLTRSAVVRGRLLEFHPRRVAAEVLECVRPDDRVTRALAELHTSGFTISLDDFRIDPDRMPLLEWADIVKLDVRAHSASELESAVATLEPYGKTLLAEKVETAEMFARCLGLGFQRFQGYFLGEPETLITDRLDSNRSPRVWLFTNPGFTRKPARSLAISAALLRP
jgi:c-di-GMP phosphodiesterase